MRRRVRQGVGVAAHGPAIRRVLRLSVLSLLWMTVEGGLGLYAGIHTNSLSLVGWALGSVIEGWASVIVIWRFTGGQRLSETSERRAQKAVAVSFGCSPRTSQWRPSVTCL